VAAACIFSSTFYLNTQLVLILLGCHQSRSLSSHQHDLQVAITCSARLLLELLLHNTYKASHNHRKWLLYLSAELLATLTIGRACFVTYSLILDRRRATDLHTSNSIPFPFISTERSHGSTTILLDDRGNVRRRRLQALGLLIYSAGGVEEFLADPTKTMKQRVER
jgi:hypothetical protein